MNHNQNMNQHDISYLNAGKRIVARLDESLDALPHDVLERLKSSRAQALKVRKITKTQSSPALLQVGRNAALELGNDDRNGWNPFISWIPFLLLVVGLISISLIQDELFTQEIADIDTELLTDDLPPSAYTDPGFALFMRMHQGD